MYTGTFTSYKCSPGALGDTGNNVSAATTKPLPLTTTDTSC